MDFLVQYQISISKRIFRNHVSTSSLVGFSIWPIWKSVLLLFYLKIYQNQIHPSKEIFLFMKWPQKQLIIYLICFLKISRHLSFIPVLFRTNNYLYSSFISKSNPTYLLSPSFLGFMFIFLNSKFSFILENFLKFSLIINLIRVKIIFSCFLCWFFNFYWLLGGQSYQLSQRNCCCLVVGHGPRIWYICFRPLDQINRFLEGAWSSVNWGASHYMVLLIKYFTTEFGHFSCLLTSQLTENIWGQVTPPTYNENGGSFFDFKYCCFYFWSSFKLFMFLKFAQGALVFSAI